MQPVVLLADDHSMIRKGLKLCLEVNLGITEIHETASCAGLMAELRDRQYTHLVLDIILGDGMILEVLPNIRELFPELKIMIFSMQPVEVYADAMRQYGIGFYLSKTASESGLVKMLHGFFENRTPVNAHVNDRYTGNPFARLSVRELEVLHYILKGKGTKEIADTLNLKMATISTLKNRIYEKMNVVNHKELNDLANLYNVNY